MFDCKNCKTLEKEVEFLRSQLSAMTDRLVALANPLALQAVSQGVGGIDPEEYYGTSSQDEVFAYDEFGQRILSKRAKN